MVGQVRVAGQEGTADPLWGLFPPGLILADSAYIVVMTGIPGKCALRSPGTVTSATDMAISSLCVKRLRAHVLSIEWMTMLIQGCLMIVLKFYHIWMHRDILAIGHAVGISASPGTRAGTRA